MARPSLAPLWQRGALVEAVDEGEEVGGVKQQTPQIQAEPRDGRARQILFDRGDVLQRAGIADPPNLSAKSRQNFCRDCTQAKYSTVAQLPKRRIDIRREGILA